MDDIYNEIFHMMDRIICEKVRYGTLYDLLIVPCEVMKVFREKYPNPTWEVTKD